jgi:hypothetical protein
MIFLKLTVSINMLEENGTSTKVDLSCNTYTEYKIKEWGEYGPWVIQKVGSRV